MTNVGRLSSDLDFTQEHRALKTRFKKKMLICLHAILLLLPMEQLM